MRREGKFGLSRRVRHCRAGRAHPNPDVFPEQLKQCFVAWRETSGVVPQKRAWTPWQPKNCCGDNGGSGGRASVCMGHLYSHRARCPLCRVGDPRKALKKNRGHLQRLRWKDVIHDSAQRDDDLVEDFDDDATVMRMSRRMRNTDGYNDTIESLWVHPVKADPQTLRRKTAVLKEFVVNCLEEVVVSELSDDPIVVLYPRCPTNCSCRPRRAKRTISRIDRLRVYEAAVGIPPAVENDWVVL